ncbi:MAG: hypothetical protein HOY75_22420 [Streptomyces sp.]|nr:hypothetical protein [Streptomyces sp.]
MARSRTTFLRAAFPALLSWLIFGHVVLGHIAPRFTPSVVQPSAASVVSATSVVSASSVWTAQVTTVDGIEHAEGDDGQVSTAVCPRGSVETAVRHQSPGHPPLTCHPPNAADAIPFGARDPSHAVRVTWPHENPGRVLMPQRSLLQNWRI